MFIRQVVLFLVVNCILAVTGRDTEEIVAGEGPSSHDAEVKINWGPVWDDKEGNNEFVIRSFEGDSEEDNQYNCTAPNGLGLSNFLLEVQKILPRQQIKDILKSYSEDPELKALKAFVSNPQTIEKAKAIHNSPEYQILKDYACRVLHIDLIKYNNLIRNLINPLVRTTIPLRKGIRGLVDEINSVLPRQQLRELYQNLLASDDELVKAVANLKSKEFHQLLSNVKSDVPEYKELRQQLIDLGLPVEEMRELLTNAFGWGPEFGSLS